MRATILLIYSILSLLIGSNVLFAQNETKPDFAYPKQVSQQAEIDLNKALKNKDGNEIVKSLINYAVAQDIINNDSIQFTINKIEQITTSEKDPCTKALLNTILLEIYSNIYTSNAHNINKRVAIENNTTLDIKEWDKSLFHQKIYSLCNSILSNSDILKRNKLKKFSNIITHNNLTFIFYPTLYDFTIAQISNTLTRCFIDNNTLARITTCDDFLSNTIINTNNTLEYCDSLYHEVLSFHSKDIAPYINWDIQRLKNANNSIAHVTLNNDHHIQYLNSLNHLFNKFQHSEYASLALLEIVDNDYSKIYSNRAMYQLLSFRLNQFPLFYGNCKIQKRLNSLASKSIDLKFNNVIAPNDSLTISIDNRNNSFYKIDILRIPDEYIDKFDTSTQFNIKNCNNLEIYKSLTLKCDSTIPFREKHEIKTTITQPGYYSIIAYNDPLEQKNDYHSIIHCTELYILHSQKQSIGNNSEKRIWIVNPKTGTPIIDATINIYTNQNGQRKLVHSFQSTKDGVINDSIEGNKSYLITAQKGNDQYAQPVYFYNSQQSSDEELTNATCFTALPVYHPGDTVRWSAVVYSSNAKSSQLASNNTVLISLRDANYIEIDTAIVTTDRFGRIEGHFAIPTDRLSGNFSINIIGKYNRNISRCSFMVSDYKLPTFEVLIDSINKESNGDIIINGEAKTFSGFPIKDASIELNILGQKKVSWWTNDNYIPLIKYNNITTNNLGKFSYTIPSQIFNNFINPKGLFKAQITATSANGESQSSNKIFSNGNQFRIAHNINNNTIEITDSNHLDISILNLNGGLIHSNIYYTLINTKNQEVKRGEFSSDNTFVDWNDVPSGKYKISLYSISPTTTDTTTADIRLYRVSDSLPPCDSGLWIQQNKYSITKDNSIEIIYGATFNNGEILYLLYDNDKIYEQRWIKVKAGIHRTRAFIPLHINHAKVLLFSVNNSSCYNFQATITRAKVETSINISAESFRDKIYPGSQEQWTFKVSDNSGNATETAMIFDMYSLAINKIKQHNISLSLPSKIPPIYNITISGNPYSKGNYNVYDYLSSSTCPTFTTPQLNLYNHIFGYRSRRNTILMSSSAKGLSPLNKTINDSSLSKEIESSENSHINIEPELKSPNIPLRDNETPLAFFQPMLTTDSLGQLTYTFTTPNANTTWKFHAIAFNENLDIANFSCNVIANKPIMVQPNMPRFLRHGDNITIKATVMNNNDSTLSITTIIELFNPTTNKVIAKHSQTDSITPSNSTIASIKFTAPIDDSMIGYRIKSFCENFGDGEQSLIPILPATSPVIESTTFYMGTNERSLIQELPQIPSTAKVTLEFCENPTWYAVTALPGLNKKQSRTAISAALSIYSTAIADGILRQNPQIANALYEWQHSDKTDSTFVSILSRNQDLKNILLSATPWVENTKNESERMALLSLLFNKKDIKNTLDKSIHQLATLQRNGGGWAWIAECEEASLWATLSILEKIGHLKKLYLLPDNNDINTMTENAIKYIDATYSQLYKKYPKDDYSQYVFIRDMFPEYKQSSAAKKVTNTTIQQIIANWKQYSLVKKATSAIILNNNGYNTSAREILNSITEFSQTSPSKGMWWPTIENNNDCNLDKILSHTNILDAYYQITPSNKDIDKMRQWLIINKGANDWGNSSATSYVIYTLLNTGTKWSNKAIGCEITLNNNTIKTSHFDNITGYIRTDISNLSPSGKKLTIAKHNNQPAWGSIYSQFNAKMSDIKAIEGNDISIEKKILKQVDNSWAISNNFSIGDKVKIQLTIKTKRDIGFISITDERAACFEPSEQLPKPIFSEGISFYRENRDDATNIFVTNLPKGTYVISYDMVVNNSGNFSSGIATIQSQYAPQITAHSAGEKIVIK